MVRFLIQSPVRSVKSLPLTSTALEQALYAQQVPFARGSLLLCWALLQKIIPFLSYKEYSFKTRNFQIFWCTFKLTFQKTHAVRWAPTFAWINQLSIYIFKLDCFHRLSYPFCFSSLLMWWKGLLLSVLFLTGFLPWLSCIAMPLGVIWGHELAVNRNRWRPSESSKAAHTKKALISGYGLQGANRLRKYSTLKAWALCKEQQGKTFY